MFWILTPAGDPEPVSDFVPWAQWLDRATRDGSRTLGDTRAAGVRITTTFLGLDAAWTPDRAPLLWETLIVGGPLDGYHQRYTSRAAALHGHQEACAIALSSPRT